MKYLRPQPLQYPINNILFPTGCDDLRMTYNIQGLVSVRCGLTLFVICRLRTDHCTLLQILGTKIRNTCVTDLVAD